MPHSDKRHSDRLSADCDWTEAGQPRSAKYDDVYYGDDGLAESRYVFLRGCNVPDIWLDDRASHLVVGETGFGTGLNFLALWQAWQDAGRKGSLHFISTELHPMSEKDLERAHKAFAAVALLAGQLRTQFPHSDSGRFDLVFEEGAVRLTLLIGDATQMLSNLGPDRMVDCWFLDGFAPATNPEMWSDALFREVARLSKHGARLASFTAVGDVRRRLAQVGFTVERKDGFGKKRHMSVGQFDAAQTMSPPHRLSWAGRGRAAALPDRVTIVGAGLCGLLTAHILKSRQPDMDVEVIDRAPDWSGAASSLPAALVTPWLDRGDGPGAKIMRKAFIRAVEFWSQLAGDNIWHATGLDLVAQSGEEQDQFRQLAADRPDYHYSDGILFVPQAGWVDGASALKALASGVEVKFDVGVAPTPSADHAVILCAGAGLAAAYPTADWPIKQLAGQIALADGTALDKPIKAAHYAIPDPRGRTIIGASFKPCDETVPNAADRRALLQSFDLDDGRVVEDWAGIRAALPDRLPLMGPVPDFQDWRQKFAAIQHGPVAIAGKVGDYRPGLYVLGGVGSRGFMSAPLLADSLVALICGTVPPLMRDELAALHPGRFLIRDLRRAGQETG